MARDDFNKSVIEKLKARVSLRCSNPSCRVPTSAPSDSNNVNNIGIAAHICAASPGGARYKSSMSVEERKSIDNAIWLCSNCSIDIDRDKSRYTVSVLKEWKRKAEDTARSELGQKIPSKTETIDTVAAALTGLTKNFIPSAISNVHQATSKSLESLDPRFSIKSAHENGKTSIGIFAKEDVSFSMKAKGEKAKEFLEKHRQLMEHGKEVEIKSDGISVEGSKLFEEIFGGNIGLISISPQKVKATQKLWLVQNETQLVETFDDIHGEISHGNKSFTFNGSACNDLFKFCYQKTLKVGNNKVNITLTVTFDKWEGLDIRRLPYLDKFLSLFQKMSAGWEVHTGLEIDGKKVLSSPGEKVNEWEYINDISNFLHYINCCRIISDMTNSEIIFTKNVTFSAEEHKNISEVVEIIEGKQVYTEYNLTNNVTCDIIVDNECNNVKILTESTAPNSFQILQPNEEEIDLFGVKVNLPPKRLTLNSVLPKFHGEIKKLKRGDIVKVEWVPQKDFKCVVSYDS